MFKNVGVTDRFIRGIGGIALIFIGSAVMSWTGATVWGIVLTVLGVILLGTAAVGFCPVYKLFHLNTFLPRHKT